MVFCSAERLYALAVMGGGLVDVFRDRCRADEGDRAYIGMPQQRIHRLLVAGHDIEHSVRQPRILEQLGHPQAA